MQRVRQTGLLLIIALAWAVNIAAPLARLELEAFFTLQLPDVQPIHALPLRHQI